MDSNLSTYDHAVEQGLVATHPSGTYTLCTEICRWGWYDIEALVDWTLKGDRLVIEGIAIWDPVEAEYLPLLDTDPFDAPLYARLLDDAMQKREDILDDYHTQ